MKGSVKVGKNSFPDIDKDIPIRVVPKKLWQVLCGDSDHWRAGIYSPEFKSIKEIKMLEKHSCPEFFMLIKGEITLVVEEKGRTEFIRLKPLKPILINAWHNGFSPKGKHTGMALVVERDKFVTHYKRKP